MATDVWLASLVGAAAAGLVAGALVLLVIWTAVRRIGSDAAEALPRRVGAPVVLLFVLFAMRAALPALDVPSPATLALLRHGLIVALIAGVGWLVVACSGFFGAYLEDRFPVDVADNLAARRVHTRFQVLRRLVVALTLLVCSAATLMTFPGMRTLGSGLLASAGIIGLVLGIAARPTVEAFIAGIQLAWTQPIRLDDVVILEGEWGRIEEIKPTYVVVRLWDLRRLIVPLSHLLTHPFQNWTRTSADLLGAVTVDVDYRTPVETVRRRVGEILAESPRFAGGFWNLQVVDAGPQTMRLRVLLAAPNADLAWELRCEVREKLVAYLQAAFPDCLPRVRAEWSGDGDADPLNEPDVAPVRRNEA